MKEKYIAFMEKALSAYSDAHIVRYFEKVKSEGLTEHGFPRLTANIGILISHGMRTDLLPLFREMMEFCCKTIPCVQAANDFSVREIVFCLIEVEACGVVSQEEIARWKGYLAAIEPTTCYTKFAKEPTDKVRNWALFTALSEYARQSIGLCDSSEFIEVQLSSQMQWMDENGMYMDNSHAETYQPIMYDLAPRGLFALLLHKGYRGPHYQAIDACLKKAGALTLAMQSVNGEVAFGGRSNQFLHNEAWLAAVYEYEANRYAAEGNMAMASRFKAAIVRAMAVTEHWLAKTPVRHIKNRYPTETKYGCEKYAYFDKYMITVASNLYAAYQLCDDSIPTAKTPDRAPSVRQTSRYFHKLFLRSGTYSIEFDTAADPHYDASGLGRVHKEGAPSTICLSVPCPSDPLYTLDIAEAPALSLCPAVRAENGWKFGADADVLHEVVHFDKGQDKADATVRCRFADGKTVLGDYTVDDGGVHIRLSGDGEIGFVLPAFAFDGENMTDTELSERTLSVAYEGWVCRYTVSGGTIYDSGKTGANRNGHYRAFLAVGIDTLNVDIEIFEAQKGAKQC